MKKYSIFTKRAAQIVASYIDMPISNKRLSFLFGAGINFNLAKNPISWDGLAKGSIDSFLKHTQKKYSKFEKNAISHSILNHIGNNKISISFNPSRPKIIIDKLEREDLAWFVEGFTKILKKLNGQIEIMTLNYDLLLSDILHRKSINYLLDDSTNPFDEVLHIHGIVDDNGAVSDKSILTMSDYVNNALVAEEKLTSFLLRENDNSNFKYKNETLIIIGSSLQEEHILRAFKKFKLKDINRVNILLITHQPKDKMIFKRLSKIYSDMSVQIVNINASGNYNKDFIDFWNCLSDQIENPVYTPVAGGLIDREDIMDGNLYTKLKNFFIKDKSLSLDVFLRKLNWEKATNGLLVRPIYWLEKNDHILEEGSLKKFVFKHMEKVPIGSLNFFEDDISSVEDIEIVLKEIDSIVSNLNDHTMVIYNYYISNFLEKFWSKINKNTFLKYKNICKWIYDKTSSVDSKISNEIQDFIDLKYVPAKSEMDEEAYLNDEYPTLNSTLSKIVKQRINDDSLGFKIPKNKEDVLNLMKEQSFEKNKKKILALFLIKKWAILIKENYVFFLEKIRRENIDISSPNKSWYPFYNLHILLYFVLINNDLYSKKYLKEIKSNNIYPIKQFPNSMDMINASGFDIKKYSPYDGKRIFLDEIKFKNVDEIRKLIESKRYIDRMEKESVISFFRKEFNLKKYKELLSIKEIKNWGAYHQELSKIEKNFNDWKSYAIWERAFSAKYDSHFYYDFVVLKPPYDIYKRRDYLVDILKKSYSEKEYRELTELTEVIAINNYKYSPDFLWWNSELKVIIKYFNLNSYPKELLDGIFEKKFSWKYGTFEKLLEGSEKIDSFSKLQFAFLFQGNNFSFKDIKQIVELHKKTGEGIIDSIYSMVDWIIRSKLRVSWKNDYLFFIKYIKGLEIKQNQERNRKKAINKFLRVLVFNYIEHGINLDLKEIELPIEDIFRVAKEVSNLKSKTKDNRLINVLDNRKGNVISSHSDDLFFIRRFNIDELGERAKDFVFYEVKTRLGLLSKGQYIYGKEFLDEYISTLSLKRSKKLKDILKEKKIEFDENK